MRTEQFIQRAIFVSVILSLVTLLLYVVLGFHVRMIADDFCTAGSGLINGPLENTLAMYNNFSGRYVAFYILYLIAPVEPFIHPWLALVIVVAWLLAFAYLTYQVFYYLKLPRKPLYIVSVSLVLTYTLFRIMPSYQHAFWMTAVIQNTMIALIGTTWLASILHYFSKSRSRLTLIIFVAWSCLAILFMGGLNETGATLMVGCIGLMLLGLLKFPSQGRRDFLIFVLTSGIAALTALAIAALSPGSWERRQLGIETEGIDRTLFEGLWDGIVFSLTFTFGEPFGITFGQTFSIAFLLSLFLIGFIAGLFYFERHSDYVLPAPKNLTLTFWLSLFGGLSLIFCVIFPATYAARGFLPIRPLILPRMIQLLVTLFWLYLALAAAQRHHLFNTLKQAKTWSIVLLFLSFLFIWGPAVSIYKLVNLYPDYQAYAISWDERHEYLSNVDASGTVYVPALAYDIEDDYALKKLTVDTDYWVNSCTAGYYGLDGVVVEEAEIEE